MGGIIVSDVNEFNVENQQFTIREYTEYEILAESLIDPASVPDSEKMTPIIFTEEQLDAINVLVSMGISEANAKNIVGGL